MSHNITPLSLPPYRPCNLTIRKRQTTYCDWFDSPVETMHGVLKDNGEEVTHGDYIKYFHSSIQSILKTNELYINNEKEFKNELATFIYNLS